mmetsp:Transcript_1013/g.1623  ORF Transcript_1013/g.1623 Transcript_1013/m.1623 type:complete len:96 (+) Transcript_1013:8-295(+)
MRLSSNVKKNSKISFLEQSHYHQKRMATMTTTQNNLCCVAFFYPNLDINQQTLLRFGYHPSHLHLHFHRGEQVLPFQKMPHHHRNHHDDMVSDQL